MRQAFLTIATASRLADAAVLVESLRQTHGVAGSQLRIHVLLAEPRIADLQEEVDALAAQAGFEPLWLAQLELPRPAHFVRRFNATGLCAALKPFGLRWLLRNTDTDRLVYLDADILVLAPLAPVLAQFEAGANLVLTPHLTQPIEDAFPGELEILNAGVYNLGFLGLARGAECERFLDWWGARVESQTWIDPADQRLTDQRWVDLAPGLVEGVAVCRDPGLNVAYWNLGERLLSHEQGQWQVNGRPLIFAHFSGMDLDDPASVTRHRYRAAPEARAAFGRLCEAYAARLRAAGAVRWRTRPAAWDHLADGTLMTNRMRAVFRRLWDHDGCGVDPAALTAGDFHAQSTVVPRFPGVHISHLMHEDWDARADLRAMFDLGDASAQGRYAAWWGQEQEQAREHALLKTKTQAEGTMQGQDGEEGPARGQPAGAPREGACSEAMPVPHHTPATAQPGAGLGTRMLRAMFGCMHRLYLSLPAGLRDFIRARRPAAARRYVRQSMMPVIHGQAPVPPGLTIVGHLAYSYGVGETARAMARACAAARLNFDVVNLELGGRRGDEKYPGVPARLEEPRRALLVCLNADSVQQVPAPLRAPNLSGRTRIGHWYWELEQFPQAWMGAFEEVDELWVASPFIQDCLAAVSPRPVILMPPPVEVRLERPYTRAEFGLPQDGFLFLFSYDFDSFVARKNPRACIEAFLRAFPAGSGNARLVIKTQHGDRHPEDRAPVLELARSDPRVILIEASLSRDETYGLISVCDCYISLHRSEGYGLGMAEAMSLGKPVVATGYSGNLAFMRADNSCLVGYRLVPVREGEYPCWEGQHWAEPDIDEAAGHMRRLAEDPALCARIGEHAARHMAEHFSARAAGERMRARLAAIDEGHTEVAQAPAMQAI